MEHLFNTDFKTYRKTITVDSNNIKRESVNVNISSKGRFILLTGNKAIINDASKIKSSYILCTYKNMDILDTDTVEINNKIYNITLINNTLQNHLEIHLIDKE